MTQVQMKIIGVRRKLLRMLYPSTSIFITQFLIQLVMQIKILSGSTLGSKYTLMSYEIIGPTYLLHNHHDNATP